MPSSTVNLTRPPVCTHRPKSFTILLTDATADERCPILRPHSLPSAPTLPDAPPPPPLPPSAPPPSYTSIPSLPATDSHTFVPSSPSSSSLLGSLMVIASAVTFSCSAFFVRVAESHYQISTLAVAFNIFIITALISVCYTASLVPAARLRASFSSPRNTRLLLLRGLCGALASVTCYKSYDVLPIGDAVAIYNVCPAFTTLTAFFFLRERVAPLDIWSIILGLSGALLVVNPAASASATELASSDRVIGALFAMADALFSALAYTTVRFLGGKVHFSLSVGIVGVMGSIAVAILGGLSQLITFWNHDPHAHQAVAMCACSAVLLFVAQSLLDKGLQYCPAGKAMLLRTLEVPFAYALGLVFLQESVSASAAIGSALVVLAAALIALGSKR